MLYLQVFKGKFTGFSWPDKGSSRGRGLALRDLGKGKEAVMMWLIAFAVLGVGNYMIKARRERRAKMNPYVPE